MNASIWGGLPLTCLSSGGALQMILRFVWLYGNWASFIYYISSARSPYSLFIYIFTFVLRCYL